MNALHRSLGGSARRRIQPSLRGFRRRWWRFVVLGGAERGIRDLGRPIVSHDCNIVNGRCDAGPNAAECASPHHQL
jgi:hypothetical protein